MKTSKLTSKFQATIPKNIRIALKLEKGDSIVFQLMKDGTVILKKLKPIDREYLETLNQTLTEWRSHYDDASFEHLQDI